MTLSLLTTFTATVCNGMHNSSMLVPYDETKKMGPIFERPITESFS